MTRNAQRTAKHQAKALRVRQRERDIRLAHGAQVARGARRLLRASEHREPLRGERRQHALPVREVAIWCVMRDARPTRQLAHPQALNALLLKDFSGSLEHRPRQVAVVVGHSLAARC